MQAKQALRCRKHSVSLYITYCVAPVNKYCINIASFILLCLNSQHVIFPQHRSTLHMCENKGVSYRILWKAYEENEEGKSHTPPYDAREKSFFFFYLTENHMDPCNKVEFGSCVQLSLCHPDPLSVNNTAIFFETESQCQSPTERSVSATEFLSQTSN